MKTFFASLGGALIGAVLGFILLILIGVGLIQMSVESAMKDASRSGASEDADAIVLTLDLRDSYSDQAATTGPEVLFDTPVGFIDVINRLDAASRDDRVKGVFVRTSEFGIGSARAEELRDAFLQLKAADKFIYAHTQGTFGGGPSAYRAVSAADQIWVQPGSDLIASGITFETLFLKGMFDNLSIDPEFIGLYEYKNAINSYEQEDYTEPHRRAMTELAESIWSLSLNDIAVDRGFTVDVARTALEATPLGAEELIDYGLADELGWPEEVEKRALEAAGDTAEAVSINDYIMPSAPFGAPVIAIVGGEGPIVTNDAGGSLFQAGNGFASDSVAASILEAGQDEDVKAIVFRVESPGGSPTASDQIWRAIYRVQTEHEKPVIVSMGSVAASGGYYVSAGADWILANRATITGSIGIFGGKFAISEGLARLGVNAETVKVGGPFTGAFSSTESFTDVQRERVRTWLERGYNRFLSLVAEGRDMTMAEADSVARGRVWSGEKALEKKLVDQIGGIREAILKAKEMAEIDAETEIRLVSYPMPEASFPFFGASASASSQELQALGQMAAILNEPELQALIGELQAARQTGAQARLPYVNER